MKIQKAPKFKEAIWAFKSKSYKIQAPSKVGILIVNAISKKPKYNYQNNYLIKHNNLSGFNNKYINKVL